MQRYRKPKVGGVQFRYLTTTLSKEPIKNARYYYVPV